MTVNCTKMGPQPGFELLRKVSPSPQKPGLLGWVLNTKPYYYFHSQCYGPLQCHPQH